MVRNEHRSAHTAHTHGAGGSESREEGRGVPKWLKIAAVAVPIAATVVGGGWTFTTFYADMQERLAKNRLDLAKQESSQKEADKEREALRLAAESEQTARQEQQHQFLKLSGEQNARFQLDLQAQVTRQREAERKQAEAQAQIAVANAKEAEQRRNIALDAAKLQLAQQVSALVAELASPSPDKTSEAPLLALEPHAKDPALRPTILRGLEVRSAARFKTLGEAVAATRLAQALMPDSFDIVASIGARAADLSRDLIQVDWLTRKQLTIDEFLQDADAAQKTAAARRGRLTTGDVFWATYAKLCGVEMGSRAPLDAVSPSPPRSAVRSRATTVGLEGLALQTCSNADQYDVIVYRPLEATIANLREDAIAVKRELARMDNVKQENPDVQRWLMRETLQTLGTYESSLLSGSSEQQLDLTPEKRERRLLQLKNVLDLISSVRVVRQAWPAADECGRSFACP